LVDLRLDDHFIQRVGPSRLFGWDAEGATQYYLAGGLDRKDDLKSCHDGSPVAAVTVQ
jgi:hypothetical protein